MNARGHVGSRSQLTSVVVLLALLIAVGAWLLQRDGERYVTVDFKQANSLYQGSDVKVLGVPIGTVKSLTPKGEIVRVKIAYSDKYRLPAGVKAAIISPSIVGDRFVQLAPAYSGGAVLPDNASIGVERSAVPVELDKVYSSLDDLAVALGPQGANKNGSLSRLIDTGAKSLDGQGAQLNTTIKNFSQLSRTLSDNKDDLFSSLDEVETFVAMLKGNDAAVRAFNDSTARVSTVLAGERDDLAATLKTLGLALNDVHTVVKENRAALRGNVDNLTQLSKILVANRDSLEETIKAAPTALSNVAFTYNAKYGTLDTRTDMAKVLTGGLQDPKLLLCSLLGEPGEPGDACTVLTQPAPGPGAGDPAAALAGALGRAAVVSTPQSERVNDSIADMLGVAR